MTITSQASPVVHPNPLPALRPKASQPEKPRLDLREIIVGLADLSPLAHSMLHRVIWDRSVRGSLNHEVAYTEKLLNGSRALDPENHTGTRVRIFRKGSMTSIESIAAKRFESTPSQRNDARAKQLWAVNQDHRRRPGTPFVCLHCGQQYLGRLGRKFCCNAHKTAYCRAQKSKT